MRLAVLSAHIFRGANTYPDFGHTNWTHRQTPIAVTAAATEAVKGHRKELATVLENTLGILADLHPFYAIAESDRELRTLVRRFIGFRPPRFTSLFEAIVNAIACRQLSLTVGIILLNRLACAYGPGSFAGQGLLWFPLPERVAKLHPEQLGGLGFSRQKAQALIGIANGLSNCSNRLDNLDQLPDEVAFKELPHCVNRPLERRVHNAAWAGAAWCVSGR